MNICPKCWVDAARVYRREGNLFIAEPKIICPEHGEFDWPVKGGTKRVE